MTNIPLSPREALPKIKALLSAGQSCRLVVTGTSMLPFLRHKQDAVLLVPVKQTIRRGDILFYLRGPEVCILHRVHQVLPDGKLLLCGDAQTALEPVHRSQVLASVSHVERSGVLTDCTAPVLRLQVALWQLLHPIRPYLLAILRRLSGIT